MSKFFGLTKRNLLIFFKDKQSVVFSLLTSIIVFALYLLFLKGSFVDAINSALEEAPMLIDLVSNTDIEMYANITLLVGILGSAMITVPFNCLMSLVKDRENKVDYDILATPIKRWQIIVSYFTASVISAVIMTSVILTVGLMILSIIGNLHMEVGDYVAAYAIVALGSISATALFMIVVLFFKSSSAGSAFFGMLSAAAGFVIGAYIPISQFSKTVQTVCNLFPGSHVTIMLRNILLNPTLEQIDQSIGGVDQGMFVETIRDTFSFKANMLDYQLDMKQMMIYVCVLIVISIAGMILTYSKTYRKH